MLDVDVNDGVYVNNERQQSRHNSGISFPVIRKEYWERALSQAQQDHERQQRIQRDVHGENQNTQQNDELESGRRAKKCFCDRTFWTSTDALQGAQVVLELGSTQRNRARIEQEMVDKGDAIGSMSGQVTE